MGGTDPDARDGGFRSPEHDRERLLERAVAFAAIWSILAIRSHDAVLLPVLGFEDGNNMLAFYFNTEGLSSILRFYAGYVSLVPNAIGWAATFAPLPAVPYLFTIASLTFAALGPFLLSGRGIAWLIPSRRDRIAVAILIALLPLGKSHLINNLTYSQWSLLFVLFVLTSQPVPRSKAGAISYSLGAALCGCSNPLSFLALPLCVGRWLADDGRTARISTVFIAASLIVYQLVGVHRVATPDFSLASIAWGIEVFFARVPFEALAGPRLTNRSILELGALPVASAGAVLVIALLAAIWTGGRRRAHLLAAILGLAIAVAIVIISTTVRYTDAGARAQYLELPYLQRYFYVPKLIFVFLFLMQIVPPMTRAVARAGIGYVLAGAAAASVYVVWINLDNAFLFRESRAEGLRVREFLRQAEADLRSARNGGPYRPEHVLERSGNWSFSLSIGDRAEQSGDTEARATGSR